tara:strand:- start:573 stop:1409 length:837 start_codon:yes stop_codon:yes gene_type:complete
MEYYKKYNIIDKTRFFHKGVRDDKNIDVYICNNTKALVLNKIKDNNYNENNLNYWNCDNIESAWKITYDDDLRRFNLLKKIKYNTLLDFGCGNGGLLNLFENKENLYGIELNKELVDILNNKNFNIYNNIDDINIKSFDCITLFHVLEHLYEPIEVLKKLKSKMNSNSVLIIEIPHANDILIKEFNSSSFKQFTFWSEHLILHTEESIVNLLKLVGFCNINITYEQRYNIFNHLNWLCNNKPGGHKTTGFNDNNLVDSYNNFLKKNKLTDTLIIYCKL